MSISFTIRKQGITDFISLPNDATVVDCQSLKQLIIAKRNLQPHDFQAINILNPVTGLKYQPHQQIPYSSVVAVQKVRKNESNQRQVLVNDTLSQDQLDSIAKNSKFFIIKSSNQENIQKSRQHGVWATTYSNQDRLKAAFSYYPHVLLLFATNRSYQIKGLARMESQPAKVPDKAIWTGVSNIRLGGNFKIRWLRKKPINFLQVQKSLGVGVKDQIMRLSDGQQIESQLGRKISGLFEVPKQPEMVFKMSEQRQPSQVKVANLREIIGSSNVLAGRVMAPLSSSLHSPSCLPGFLSTDNHGISSKISVIPSFMVPPSIQFQSSTIFNTTGTKEEDKRKTQSKHQSKSKKEKSTDKKHKKDKKGNKQKVKKIKKKKRSRSLSSSSEDESSSSSSSRSSSSSSSLSSSPSKQTKKPNKQKHKRRKQQKKQKKDKKKKIGKRSPSKDLKRKEKTSNKKNKKHRKG